MGQRSRKLLDEECALLAFLESALPEVYDYLLHRVGNRALAEDLTSETFLAAVAGAKRSEAFITTMPWLIGIARHKLTDHWRRQEREARRLARLAGGHRGDACEESFEAGRASDVLALLNPSQRAALTLHYVDGLPVAQVAELLGRSVHATETLLVRAKRAFRMHYEAQGGDDDGSRP